MFRANAEGLKIIWIDRRLIPGSGNRWGAKDPPDRSKNQTLFSEFLSVIGFVVSVDTLFAVIPEQVQPHVCTPLQPGTLGAFLQLCQSIRHSSPRGPEFPIPVVDSGVYSSMVQVQSKNPRQLRLRSSARHLPLPQQSSKHHQRLSPPWISPVAFWEMKQSWTGALVSKSRPGGRIRPSRAAAHGNGVKGDQTYRCFLFCSAGIT
ncbi:uncharacterized protein LOC112152246 isoform X1 [Oryzias melastigma]|uniref:uncharacterized protein LOC112152246 isoform X1 n=1 Tax=Oryzias melastigma TaxID=30732 RepID=UPI000CF7F2DA|nr:uncharacterized protein LOC112152246 isoform X1 [Oryzias melastigma]